MMALAAWTRIKSRAMKPWSRRLLFLLLISFRGFFSSQNQCFRNSRAVPRTFESNPKTLHYEWHCVGSIEGWLIMVESSSKSSPIINFFADSVSNVRVALPSQSTIESPVNHIHHFFHKVVASSSPMGPQRCLVAAIVANREVRGIELLHDLALCRLTHTSWTIIKVAEVADRKLLFRDIEIIDQKLCAATKNFLMVFHIKDIEGGRSFSDKLVETVKLQYDKVDKPVTWPCYEDGPYLVKDATSKELFVIVWDVALLRSLPIKYRIEGFRVFKLENCIAR